MNNSTLKQLLLEYSRKRNKEIVEANIKKEKIYQENPRLQEIDDELSKFSIQTAKSILQTNDRSLLDTLKSKKEYLLNEKNEIYYLQSTLRAWYNDMREKLLEGYQNGIFTILPEWDGQG